MSDKKPSLPQRSLGGTASPTPPAAPQKPAAPQTTAPAEEEFEVDLDDDEPAPSASPPSPVSPQVDVSDITDPWGDGKEEITSRGLALETVSPNEVSLSPPPPPPVVPSASASVPPPAADTPKSSFVMLMEGADELFSLGDFSGSLETVEKALEIKPQDAHALDLLQKNKQTLMKMFESRLSGLQKRPRVRVDPSEVMWLSLDHRAGFVLAQIDGFVTYEEVLQLSSMSRFDTLRILAKLCEEGVIEGT